MGGAGLELFGDAMTGTETIQYKGRIFRLGKRTPRVLSVRHLMASRRMLAQMPVAPETRDWTAKVSFPAGVMGNDVLSDCTGAGAGHYIQTVTANASTEVTVADADVIAFYSGSTGYVPGDASTDQGGVEADVLAYFQKTGLAGIKIDGFAQAQAQNLAEIRQVVNTFGGCYIGLALPKTIESEENQGDTWDVDLTAGQDAERGSLGGHCVVVEGYDQGGFFVITWGLKIYLTNAFMTAYNDEAWALLASGIWAPNGTSPAGDTVPALDADLQAVA